MAEKYIFVKKISKCEPICRIRYFAKIIFSLKKSYNTLIITREKMFNNIANCSSKLHLKE